MTRRDGIARGLLALLILAVLAGTTLILVELARTRQLYVRSQQMLEKIQKRLARRGGGGARRRTGVFANAEYFDPDRADGDGILRTSISADPPSLNPIISNEATASEIYSHCMSSLAGRNWARPDGEYLPMMAESWEMSKDHLTYRIRLRKGIMWNDYTDPATGEKVPAKEVTAADFRFFIDVVRNPDVNCAPLRVYYQDLDDLEVVGPYEFVVKWKKPFYGSVSATLGMSPLPKHYYHHYPGPFDGRRFNDDHKRNSFIVGCGPYRFRSWERNRRIELVRNEEYFGADYGAAPAVERRVFEVVKLPGPRFQQLAAGKLDMINLTPDQWRIQRDHRIFASGKVKRFKYPALAYSYIGYNQKCPLFRDKRVRQALTMLVDRERIIRDIMNDLATPIKSPFPASSQYSDPALKPWPYDPERAKKLLAEAGWRDTDGDGILDKDGRKFAFTIMQVAGHPTQSRIFPMIKESFAAAGIDMNIQPLEWSVYLERLNNRSYEVCCLGWTMSFDPDPYQVWHSSGIASPGSNHICYANPELDKLIEKLRETFDMKERVRIARRIEAIIHEDQPYTFLYQPDELVALWSHYDNARLFPGGLETLIFVDKRPAP